MRHLGGEVVQALVGEFGEVGQGWWNPQGHEAGGQGCLNPFPTSASRPAVDKPSGRDDICYNRHDSRLDVLIGGCHPVDGIYYVAGAECFGNRPERLAEFIPQRVVASGLPQHQALPHRWSGAEGILPRRKDHGPHRIVEESSRVARFGQGVRGDDLNQRDAAGDARA